MVNVTFRHHDHRFYCNSHVHSLQGPDYGPPGSTSCKVDLAGTQGQQADSLSMVYWWLAVIVKRKKGIPKDVRNPDYFQIPITGGIVVA